MILKNLKSKDKYHTLYSDPPWKQMKGGIRKTRPNQTRSLDYETLTLESIKNIHQIAMRNLMENDHVCFLWTIDKFLHNAEQMMEELGYKLHARIVWDKENGVAPAFTIRYAHEYLLWFYKGKMLKIAQDYRGKYTTVIREKSTKHSKKPISAYEMIENLYPSTNKIELFARNERSGWDCWGSEV